MKAEVLFFSNFEKYNTSAFQVLKKYFKIAILSKFEVNGKFRRDGPLVYFFFFGGGTSSFNF